MSPAKLIVLVYVLFLICYNMFLRQDIPTIDIELTIINEQRSPPPFALCCGPSNLPGTRSLEITLQLRKQNAWLKVDTTSHRLAS